ncbi:MAG: hypothetical protein QG565_1348 [Campylobacterota bacterium]|nr:hypothetical protein [Campylobacterota bacterium]MDQ1338601.1 hypothetical protein [Campylobacterota bacterium]
MSRRSGPLFFTFLALAGVFCFEVIYLQSAKGMSSDMLESKKDFVSLVGLSDLAISTEATYVRHRSVSELFSIYKDDGSLREYFPSTYVYSHSGIINKKSFDAH